MKFIKTLFSRSTDYLGKGPSNIVEIEDNSMSTVSLDSVGDKGVDNAFTPPSHRGCFRPVGEGTNDSQWGPCKVKVGGGSEPGLSTRNIWLDQQIGR